MLTYFNLKESFYVYHATFLFTELNETRTIFLLICHGTSGCIFYTESDLNGKEAVSTGYKLLSVLYRSFRMFNFIALTTEKTYIEINGMEV